MNYWRIWSIKNANAADQKSIAASKSPVVAMKAAWDTVKGVTPLTSAEITSTACQNSGASWTNCKNAFATKLGSGMITIKNALNALDTAGVELFTVRGYQLLKLFVLLGDKYRQQTVDAGTKQIRYPVALTDLAGFVANVFADSTVLYRRTIAPAQFDLGTLYCPREVMYAGQCVTNGWDYSTWASTVPVSNPTISQVVLINDMYTTTGLFALPGRTVTITRTDSLSADVKVYIQVFFQREVS